MLLLFIWKALANDLQKKVEMKKRTKKQKRNKKNNTKI